MPNITLSVRLMGVPKGSGQYSEWLKVIHAINDVHPGYIATPTDSHEWWAGGWCEEYPEFRVILREDETANVQAKTPEAAEALRVAFRAVTGLEAPQ